MGRTRELAQLDRALEVARGGQPRVVVILGPAGIGKTALIRRFEARHALPIETGACLPFSAGEVPFLPFIELLRGMVRRLPPERLLPILGPARAEVARLVPELGPVRPREDDPGLARALLFEQLRGVAERLGASEPHVLAVEDLQWADGSTRDLLLFLVRNVRSARLLLLLTARMDGAGPGHPLASFLAELERDESVERLDLAGLDREDVAAQAAAILGAAPPARLVDRLTERTDGNPLFVEELLAGGGADAGAQLPPRLRDALAARLQALPADDRRLLGLVAVAGRHADPGLLARLTGWTEDRLEDALESTITAGAVAAVPVTDRVVPRHPLLGEVAEAELPAPARARAHAACATALEDRGGGPEVQAEVANHWAAAGVADRALAASIAAGLAAGHAIAPGAALDHLERALVLMDRVPDAASVAGMDRVGLLERVADAALRAGDHERAVRADVEALGLVDAVADPGRAADLRRSLRWARWSAGDAAGALREGREALALLEGGPPSVIHANTLAHVAGLELVLGDSPGALADAEAARAEAAGLPEAGAELALAIGVIGLARLRLGDSEGGLAFVREAWDRAVALGHVTGIVLAQEQLAGALSALGRTSEAAALARAGVETAERLGLDRTVGVLLRAHAADACVALGRWAEARRDVEAGLDGEPAALEGVAIHVVAARLAAGVGDRDGAVRHLALARALAGPRAGADAAIARAAAETARLAGDAAGVRTIVASGLAAGAADPGIRAELVLLGLWAETELGRAARARGGRDEPAQARRTAAALLLRLRAPWPGAARDLVRAFRLAGLAEVAARTSGAAARRWERSMDAWHAAGRPVAAARAAVDGAAAAVSAGQREDAERLAAAARSAAVAIGAVPIVIAVDELARRARLRIGRDPADEAGPEPRVVPAGPGGSLTERELDVLRLLAQGRSNREIGEALFISPKTVSVHVTNILGKLGVDGRVEAATTALRLGLIEEP